MENRTESKVSKVCKKCHGLQRLEDFPANKQCKDGHEGQCKACKYAARKTLAGNPVKTKTENQPQPKTLAPMPEPPASSAPPIIDTTQATPVPRPAVSSSLSPAAKAPPAKVITLCLDDHPDIYDAVITIAKDEFRSPDMQVLYWVAQRVIKDDIQQLNR